MNSTALGAGNLRKIIFADLAHKRFYFEQLKFVEDMLLDFFRHSAACILLSKISYKKGHFPKITFRKMSLLHKLHLL